MDAGYGVTVLSLDHTAYTDYSCSFCGKISMLTCKFWTYECFFPEEFHTKVLELEF